MNSDNIWLDPLYLDDLLSEEEKSIRKTTHEYCNKNLLPIVIKDNQKHHFDKSIYKDFGSMGFLGSTIDGYGSSNSSKVSYGLIAAEFESIYAMIVNSRMSFINSVISLIDIFFLGFTNDKRKKVIEDFCQEMGYNDLEKKKSEKITEIP